MGSVATAGMMQELKIQTGGFWSHTVMLQNISLSRITASVSAVSLGNRDFNQRIFTDVSKLLEMMGYCGHSCCKVWNEWKLELEFSQNG